MDRYVKIINLIDLRILLPFIALLIGFAAPNYQEKEDIGRTKTPDFQEHIAVNYMLIDVVVTDSEGNYVRDLKLDDFEVFENGKKVALKSIDEYKMLDQTFANSTDNLSADLESGTQPPRSIVFFFDMIYGSEYGVRRAVKVTDNFIEDRLRTGDRIMILSYFHSLQMIQPFTADKNKALERMRTMARNVNRANAFMGMDPSDASPRFVARNYLESMQALAKVLKSYPGRKTMIMLSEGMNFALIDPFSYRIRKPPVEVAQTQDITSRSGQEIISRYNEKGAFPLFQDYMNSLRLFNDANTSIYTLNVAGLQALGDPSAAEGNPPELELKLVKDQQDFLSSVAEDTNGRAYFNSNDLGKLLNDIEVDISNYYLLGYSSQFDPGKSVYRNITVKVNKPGLKVLHRKGFYTPRPFNTLSKDERDLHLTEGFLSRAQINELDAYAMCHMLRSAPDTLNAHVCMEIPYERLSPRDDKIDIEVLVSNVDDKGEIFSSHHKQYRISGSENPALKDKGLRITEILKSTSGINRIRIALRDNNSGKRTYFYFNYNFQSDTKDKLLVNQPFFYDPDDLKRVEGEFPVEVEPLEIWNQNTQETVDLLRHPALGTIFPLNIPVYKRGEKVNFSVSVYNVGREVSDIGELTFEMAISPVPDAEGGRNYYRITTDDPDIQRLPLGNGIAYRGAFEMYDLPEGAQDLFIKVTDKATGRQEVSSGRLYVKN